MVSRFLHSKIGSNIVVAILGIAALALVIGSTGCQFDYQIGTGSVKILRKGENGNKEYLSRGSGMKTSTGFVVGNPNCVTN